MDYNFSVERRGDFLHATVTGPNTPEVVRSYLERVRQVCREQGCPNVLIEEVLEGPPLGIIEIYRIVSEAGRGTWPDVQRVAFVNTNPEQELGMKFAEDVAVNRGMGVKAFRTVREAEAWLAR